MKLRWTDHARRDLLAIGRYIARDNLHAARRWVEQLRERARRAAENPLTGRVVPELGRDDVREDVASGELSGIFVLDRDRRRISRVRGSEDASRLAFPDFVGADSIIFLLPGRPGGEPSRFRLVCCIR